MCYNFNQKFMFKSTVSTASEKSFVGNGRGDIAYKLGNKLSLGID